MIIADGSVEFTGHAKNEMRKDRLTAVDVVNILRAGVVEEPEWENGDWRHRVRTHRMAVVVSIRSDTELTVITVWRIRQ